MKMEWTENLIRKCVEECRKPGQNCWGCPARRYKYTGVEFPERYGGCLHDVMKYETRNYRYITDFPAETQQDYNNLLYRCMKVLLDPLQVDLIIARDIADATDNEKRTATS